MNVTEALHSRYTCRSFKAQPLEKEKILAILEAANRAPSWANTQPWEIFVAGGAVLEGLRKACLKNFRQGLPGNSDIPRAEEWPSSIADRIKSLMAARSKDLGIDRADGATRKAMAERTHRFFGAPIVLYLCMDRSLTSWSMHDLGMMSQSIMLAAEERGIASAIAYNMVIYPDLIRKAIGIPEELAIVIAIALGYADDGDPQNVFHSPRRSMEEVVRFTEI